MKISVMTAHLSGHGGTETVLRKFVNGLQTERMYNIKLIIDGDSDEKSWMETISSEVNCKIFASHNNFLKLIFALLTFLFSNDDIFILTDTRLILVARIVKKIFFKKYTIVSWIHFSIFDSSSVNTKYLKCADYHLAISSGISRQMVSLGIKKDRIFTIFNPVSKSQNLIFPTAEGKIKNFIYIGRIQFLGQKNLKLLIDALSKQEKNWQLDVYGDGEELGKCEEYAEKLGLNTRIRWNGWVSDPWGKIKKCDALLLTSKFEGFPMILLESLAHGVPCISSKCPTGPEDIIQEGKNGFLFENGNQQELEGLINRVIGCTSVVSPKIISESVNDFYDEKYFIIVNKILRKIA